LSAAMTQRVATNCALRAAAEVLRRRSGMLQAEKLEWIMHY